MIQVDSKPADLGESGWRAILSPRQAHPSLTQDIDCDYLVVGAGFAGLSAARRLSQLEPQASVVILEAEQVASGPAGRNSGFMIDLPHALATGSYGGEDSQDLRNIRMNRAAIAFAADTAHGFGFPDEAFEPCGKINVAACDAGSRHNSSYARHLDTLGEPYELLDAAAMQAICGSDYYRGGLRTPGTAVLQPALFVRSFADALVKHRGCQLYENSALRELSRKGDRWVATTATGSVTANRVILAVNGLIESFGFYRHRLMHINLSASMTWEPRDAAVDKLGAAGRWGSTPSDPTASTLRRIAASGAPRLVMRNTCPH